MELISFFMGVVSLFVVEMIALIWVAVVVYQKQQAAKVEVATAAAEAIKLSSGGASRK
jgi:F0F1-type ATP synthase assembly protein I